MAIKKDMTKDEKINAEIKRLDRILSQIEIKTKKSIDSLIKNAAFMAVSLDELQAIVNEKGYTEEYQNGANQHGIKKCSEVEIYNVLVKNYMSVMKQITDLLPKSEPAEESDGFDDFVEKRADLM